MELLFGAFLGEAEASNHMVFTVVESPVIPAAGLRVGLFLDKGGGGVEGSLGRGRGVDFLDFWAGFGRPFWPLLGM